MSKHSKPVARKKRPVAVEPPPAPAAATPPAASANPQPAATPVEATAAPIPFPIIGLGSSAGGLEALGLFLHHVPEHCGAAFIVIQHLDPTQPGMLTELLQHETTMPVMQVQDRTRVEPDRVYVIPPNKDLSILSGVLHLLEPAAPRGLRLPIDFFFRALAADAGERSLGVILSGMGSDGTLGLRAIKEKAGAVFVQEPGSAKFDGMPRSAVETGLADVVAPVEELPGRIVAYLQHVPVPARPGGAIDDKGEGALEKVVILLRAQTGHDFSLYKKATVSRRIERRMGLHQLAKIADYVRFLRENPQETELLFKELLIGVTSFFRDPEAWKLLQAEVLPALLKDRPANQPLRVWMPGCSTGEEVYSLAIAFREVVERLRGGGSPAIQIFATDLDRDAIDKARIGIYPANIAADVSPERLNRYFLEVAHGYQVSKAIREAVIFAPHNLILDAPFTRLDLVTCRNLLIYFTPELQERIIPLFHYSLNADGFLFLGNSETVGRFRPHFALLPGKARIYRRLNAGPQLEAPGFPYTFKPGVKGTTLPAAAKPQANLQTLAEQLLLQRFAPAAVLVNDRGDILFISGRTGKYLEPAAGKANWNVLNMAREGLRLDLSDAFRHALREKETVTRRELLVGTDGGPQAIDLTVQFIAEPDGLRGLVLVVFTDVATPPKTKGAAKGRPADAAHLASLEEELAQAQQALHAGHEEMQTADEEAKSAQEELQSTNEELQSTNEELTTSKEEMQSMNEELQTVNAELQSKVTDLSHLNNDMKNLLDSADLATLFVDTALQVRLFTEGANRIFKLIPADVGRPITDFATELIYPELAADAREVLRTLAIQERQVTTHDGSWFQMRIRPYRTLENVIDGLVITFADITAAKNLEAALRETQAGLEADVKASDRKLEQNVAATQRAAQEKSTP